ncbi:hypothetical protein, partial [Actinomadura sp.]|uniref:hypothetical protein n=1 Tax=Actinomadura sp. TaxID=1989 RepID=UPI0037C948A6
GAGAGGAGAAGQGVVGALGAKGVAAVAGGAAAVAVGGGAAIYAAVADEAPEPVAVRLAAFTEPPREIGAGTTFQARGRIVRVTGGDAALARKINQALRAPLERRWAKVRSGLGGVGSGAYTDVVTPRILMRGDRLLSVWYAVALDGDRGTGWDQPQAATVDLRTGAAYGPPDLFRDPSERGLKPLDAKIGPHLRGGAYCAGDVPRGTDDPSAFVRSGDVTMALTREGLRVAFYGSLLGYPSACGLQEAVVPYAEVSGMLRPALLKAVPYPSPARS